jgi:hypothetical protein
LFISFPISTIKKNKISSDPSSGERRYVTEKVNAETFDGNQVLQQKTTIWQE